MIYASIRNCLVAFYALLSFNSIAQSIPSSEIYHKLLRLKETKRVLYVAAHPDDENTRLIATLANGEHVKVGYLSLTRGDGGQNLIGKELGIELGQIRTQELLRARQTDGGVQFFTRAIDFGYSKNPDETLQNWDKEKVLSDVVWVVRHFQPDIIVTRFNTVPGGGNHGHHTTSAILANEAFDLAADKAAFPEQLKNLDTWQTKRLFWNTYNFRSEFVPDENEHYAVFETGEYNSLLGKTYSQIAADSRTMHKSQGFGSTASTGGVIDHAQFEKGEGFVEGPFEGIPSRWSLIKGGEEVLKAIEACIDTFDFKNPSNNLEELLVIKQRLEGLESDDLWVREKQLLLKDLIVNSLGLDKEWVINRELGFAGQTLDSELVINLPGGQSIEVISFHAVGTDTNIRKAVGGNQPLRIPVKLKLAEDTPLSQPYWLVHPASEALYRLEDQAMIGKAFANSQLTGVLKIAIDGQEFELELPLTYKYNDQVDGEVNQPFTVVPEIDLEVSAENVFLLEGINPTLHVTVNFNGEFKEGELSFRNLEKSEFKVLRVDNNPFQKKKTFVVDFGLSKNGKRTIIAEFTTADKKVYDQITHRIFYKHIPNLTYFSPASINVIQQDWKVSRQMIGYIPGVGDDVPAVLTSLGYEVVEINGMGYNSDFLSQFKTIVVGIRAYNTNAVLAANQDVLMKYVEEGGNLVVQYNTIRPLLTTELGPYPFSVSRDRVTVEASPFNADYGHPVLARPNQMTAADFEGWVQERGLYFVTGVSPEYSAPLQFQDPGEEPSSGALIYANYGKGTYIYTGISFFRELPAGVPGATKLFINLIEQ